MDNNWDKYFEEGTNNQVLKNKLGIKDAKKLEKIESRIVNDASRNVPKVEPNFDGLKKIHKHYFNDVYEWAGQVRDVNISKSLIGGFTKTENIEKEMQALFDKLEKDNYLKGMEQKPFAHKLAETFGELNNIHPFREGNGRTQRQFIKQIAEDAGHKVDFSYVTKERMLQASEDYAVRQPQKMQDMFQEITQPKEIEMSKGFHEAVIMHNGIKSWNNTFIQNMREDKVYQGNMIGEDNKSFAILDNTNVFVADKKYLENSIKQKGSIKVAITNHQ